MLNLEAQKGVSVFATAEKVSLQLKFILFFYSRKFFKFASNAKLIHLMWTVLFLPKSNGNN